MSGNILNSDTKIEISLGKFIALLGSLLTIMFGFYLLVIEPKFDSMKDKFGEIDRTMTNMNTTLIEMNNGIGVINGNIQGINNRFRDLNTARNNNQNSGGSFGN